MKNMIFTPKLLLCLAIFLHFPLVLGGEVRHQQFSIPQSVGTEEINGQIDWPSGPLGRWNGPVVVLISGGRPHDRDGWMVLATETVWANRLPFKELSAALVKQGMAVVRFDNPGVRKPELKCRETILMRGVSSDTVRHRCLDSHVLAKFTVEKYQRSIEEAVLHVESLLPGQRGDLVFFGFSEGLLHAAMIAERKRIHLQGLISIGSPAESVDSATQWQAIDRLLELLPRFDANGDGIVSNDEIRKGHKKGIGNVMGMNEWISPDGYWDLENESVFRSRLEKTYKLLMDQTNTGLEPGNLGWNQQANGALVPDANDALWNFLFHGQVSPADVMQRSGLPGLFMWGEGDTQVSVRRQVDLINQAIKKGADIRYLRFPGRYHLLSRRRDFDWLEKSFMPVIAREVRTFLEQLPGTQPQTAALPAQQVVD